MLFSRRKFTKIGSISLSVSDPVFGRPFVKRFALCYQTVVCLVCVSVLSVRFVHCGHTVGRIKMKLGTQVGHGPDHIVLDGDPAPLPHLSRPNGCMDQDQDVTWYGATPRPRRLCVRWGPRSPPQRGGGLDPPNFRPMFIVVKRLDG